VRKLDSEATAAIMRAAGLEPLEPYPGAGKPWRCSCACCGHTVTPRYNDVNNGLGGCVWCAGQAVEPKAAAEVMTAAGLEPLEPYPGSSRTWRCLCLVCGQEVTPRYSNIRAGSGGCRHRRPRLLPEEAEAEVRAAGFEPLEPFPGMGEPWHCRCNNCERAVKPRLSRIRAGVAGCRYCSGYALDPSAAMSVMKDAGLEPLEPFPGSGKQWRCRCVKCQREVTPRYMNVKKGHGGCAYCAKQAVKPSEAAEVMRAAGLEPIEAYPGAHTPWPCRCVVCGRVASPTYRSVVVGGGCVWCARRRVDPIEAEAAMRVAGLLPLVPFPGAPKPWLCECMTCGLQVTPMYSSIQQGQGGCLRCAGNLVLPGEAAALMREAGLEPLVEYPGSGEPWPCRCSRCGRQVSPRYAHVRMGHSGCGYCSKTLVDAADAEAVMRAAGVEPLVPYPGSGVTWRCRCDSCGREVKPVYGNVIQGHRACKWCAPRGYWANADSLAVVYLIAHPPLGALKIGIAREHTTRIEDHRKLGWSVINTWPGVDPEIAFRAEKNVLDYWRSDGIPDAVSRADMPQGGHTETAPLDLVDLARTRLIVEATLAREPRLASEPEGGDPTALR
jgi:recombinational DNA repair protein (RecF pathway)